MYNVLEGAFMQTPSLSTPVILEISSFRIEIVNQAANE